MAEISAQAVKALRDKTGAGMMDCKKALAESGGDVEKAVEALRERGLAKAGKRSGRATSEGAVAVALGDGCAALVEVGCETDFVAKTDAFQALIQRLADAAASREGADTPDKVLEIESDGKKLAEHVTEGIASLGENLVVKRVARIDAPQVGGYVHAGGKLGVIVGLATSAKGEAVEALARDLAMHVAAHDPTPVAVDPSGVPSEVVEKERELFRRQAEQEGKPANVLERIVEGKLKKFYSDVTLLEQGFVKDPDRSVGKLLAEAGKQLGGDVTVSAFVRFKLGEADEE